MATSKEFRELQVSSGQLVVVFLSILVLGVFIFFLGVLVGKKQGQLVAAAAPAAVKTETVAPLLPLSPDTSREAVAQETRDAGLVASSDPKPLPATSATAQEKPATEKPADRPIEKPAVAAKKPTPPAGGYFVQVAALAEKSAASSYAQQIESLGFEARVLDPLPGDRTTVYRVRVGPFGDKDAAENARTKVAEALKRKASEFFVVKV